MSKLTLVNAKVDTNKSETIALIKKDSSELEMQSTPLEGLEIEGLQISEELFDELLDLNRELSLLKLSED